MVNMNVFGLRKTGMSAFWVLAAGLCMASGGEVLLEETFEELSPGSLHGQNGWIIERGRESENAIVQSRQAYESSQALELKETPGQVPSNWVAHGLQATISTSRLTVTLRLTGVANGRKSAQISLGAAKNPWDAPLVSVRSYADESTKWMEVFSYQSASGEWVNTTHKMGAGAWWELKVELDVAKGVYTFQVTPSGGEPITIARDIEISNKLPRGTVPQWLLIARTYGQSKDDVVLIDDIKVIGSTGD